jgi:hypothetical protein
MVSHIRPYIEFGILEGHTLLLTQFAVDLHRKSLVIFADQAVIHRKEG